MKSFSLYSILQSKLSEQLQRAKPLLQIWWWRWLNKVSFCVLESLLDGLNLNIFLPSVFAKRNKSCFTFPISTNKDVYCWLPLNVRSRYENWPVLRFSAQTGTSFKRTTTNSAKWYDNWRHHLIITISKKKRVCILRPTLYFIANRRYGDAKIIIFSRLSTTESPSDA